MTDTRWFLLYYDVSVPDAAAAGLMRLQHRDGVERHEQLGRSGTWERTNYFLSSRRGDQTFDEVQVDAHIAAAFEAGVRARLGVPQAETGRAPDRADETEVARAEPGGIVRPQHLGGVGWD